MRIKLISRVNDIDAVENGFDAWVLENPNAKIKDIQLSIVQESRHTWYSVMICYEPDDKEAT